MKSETAVGIPDSCLDYWGTSKMTKEAAGAKKAESDGEIFLENDFSASCWRWKLRFLEGRSEISLINNIIPLCNRLADTLLHQYCTDQLSLEVDQ